jgi:hypothetical protein
LDGPLFPPLQQDLRLVGLRPAVAVLAAEVLTALPLPAAVQGWEPDGAPAPLLGLARAASLAGDPLAGGRTGAAGAAGEESWVELSEGSPDGADQATARPEIADPVAAADLVLTIQNEGPCRRRLELGAGWQVLERLDGLDRPWRQAGDLLTVSPWQLAFWRIRPSSVPH